MTLPQGLGRILAAQGSFWRDHYRDQGQMELTARAMAQLLGDAYQDLCRTAARVGIPSTSLWVRQRVVPLWFGRHEIAQTATANGTVWRVGLPPDWLAVPWLYDRVLSPTHTWTQGVDYDLRTDASGRRVLDFFSDPFAWTTAARRTVSPPPATLAQGLAATYNAGLADSALPDPASDLAAYVAAVNARDAAARVLTVTGAYYRTTLALALGADRLSLRVPTPQPLAVGDVVRVVTPGGIEARTVAAVLAPDTVRLSAGVAVADADAVELALERAAPTAAVRAGDTLELLRADGAWTAVLVAEVISATQLRAAASLALPRQAGTQTNVVWRVQRATVVEEVELYAVDLRRDAQDLATRYGALVGRARESSDLYRGYLDGVARYQWRGPTQQAARALLSLTVGVPVIEEDGEVLEAVLVRGSAAAVRTHRRSYVLPAALLSRDLATAPPGRVFAQGELLTDAVEALDAWSDPTWMYDRDIPATVWDPAGLSARVLPQPEDLRLNGRWRIGQPGVGFGRRSDGSSISAWVHKGSDAYWVNSGHAWGALEFTQLPLHHQLGRKPLYLDGYRVLTGDVVAGDTLRLVLRQDIAAARAAATLHVLVSAGIMNVVAGARLYGYRDVGRFVYLDRDPYVIDAVVGPYEARLRTVGGDPATAVGYSGLVTLGLIYTIYEEGPSRLTPGHLAQILAGPNVFHLQVDTSNAQESALISARDDVAELMIPGRPAHGQLALYGYIDRRDFAGAVEGLDAQTWLPPEIFGVARSRWAFSDGWVAGDFFRLPLRAVQWERRLSLTDLDSALPALPGDLGRASAGVVDARTASLVSLLGQSASGTWEAPLECWVWVGDFDDATAAWARAPELDLTLDQDAPFAEVPWAGLVVAVRLAAAATVTSLVLAQGAQRRVRMWQDNPSSLPAGVAEVADGSDEVELDAEVFELDLLRRIVLTYPRQGTIASYSHVVRIDEVLTSTRVRVVDDATGAAYAADRDDTTMSWRMDAHRGWGQTPLRLCDGPNAEDLGHTPLGATHAAWGPPVSVTLHRSP